MNNEVIFNKIESLRKCLVRIKEKTPADYETLLEDYDLQDIICLNLERAVQNSVDIATSLIAETDSPAPDTMRNAFEILAKSQYTSRKTAVKMQNAVGFRNIAVHTYQDIDWAIVYKIITEHLDDFKLFIEEILKHD
ncbi:MAG: DUF86 domain-containing protein [Verrucomicrobiota bacterium]|nr:DUF86 domain-containing protein [Verrucomicrobiota bacterium]